METVTVKGKELPISGYREINGKKVPVIKAEAVEIKRPDGGTDVIVKVPCLKIEAKINQKEG